MRIGEVIAGQYEVRKQWRRVTLLLDLSTGRHSVARPAEGFTSLDAVDLLRGVIHPSLPRVFGEIENEGIRWILFEYLPGVDLETRVRREGGALPAREAAAVTLGMARTVAFLHDDLERPLVHLDIKPEHIILSGGTPCLIDFSSAVVLPGENGTDNPDEGVRVREATPLYAAPETTAWRGPCIQSDIYSLGVTLFCALGGTLPTAGRLPDLRDLPGGDVPEGLRDVVGRCLMADPAARYPSMAALADALSDAGAVPAMSIGMRI
ncbi:MAG: protein kinase [Clostridia bacterium]|nr:protein kinase [Clostridia bacterium]